MTGAVTGLMTGVVAVAVLAAPSGHATVYRLNPDDRPLSHTHVYDGDTDGGDHPREVRSPDRPGHRALRFSVPGGGTRSEVVPRLRDLREGDDLTFRYRFVLPRSFPIHAHSWQLIEQWHSSVQNGSSPTVSIEVQDGQWVLDGGYGAPGYRDPLAPAYHRPMARASVGAHSLTTRIVFSHHRATGRVDVWLDGRRILTDYHPPAGTLYRPARSSAYLKIGVYRDPDLGDRATLFVDDLTVTRRE